MAVNEPLLSVLLVCYNQKDFLPQALDSVLRQKTSFEFEIVAADDASTDGSRQLLEEYAAKHPTMRILPPQANLGVTRNYQRGFAACQGRYVAVLEADDYWVREDRLEIMVSFLEANPIFSMAANRFLGLYENGLYFWYPLPLRNEYPLYLSAHDLIFSEEIGRVIFFGNFSTCVYRKAALEAIPPKLFEHMVYDWPINIAVARYGPVACFPELMSVYRILKNSTWNRQTEQEKRKEMMAGVALIEEFFPEFKERCALFKLINGTRWRFLRRCCKPLLRALFCRLARYM